MSNLTEHIHGGNALYDFNRLNITPKEIIDFSVNINPLGPPQEVKRRWNTLYADIQKYPTQNGLGVKSYYETKFNINYENILPGNGSTELFYSLLQHLSLKSVLVITPSFNDYSKAALANNCKVLEIKSVADNSFGLPSIELLNNKLRKTDAVFIGHPNNPTGTIYSRDEIKYLAKTNPQKWILLDEAFIQFVYNFEKFSFLKETLPHNIILFHSLTKFYTLPGLRLGAMIAHKKVIFEMEKRKYLWSINRPAEAIARILSDDSDFSEKTLKHISAERNMLFKQFSKIDGIKIFPTSTNFFLAQWKATDNLDDLQKALLSSGLYVRDARNFPLLSDNYFRFAILKKTQNSKLISAIKKTLLTQ